MFNSFLSQATPDCPRAMQLYTVLIRKQDRVSSIYEGFSAIRYRSYFLENPFRFKYGGHWSRDSGNFINSQGECVRLLHE